MKKITWFLLTASILAACNDRPGREENAFLSSPDGKITVEFKLQEGVPHYNVKYAGDPIIDDSRLGFILKEAPDLTGSFEIVGVDQNSFDNTWETVWGQDKEIRNNYNELTIQLEESATASPRTMFLVFRVFNDGLGFRYEIPEQPVLSDIEILSEETEFKLAGDLTLWYQQCDTLVKDTWEHGFDTYERLYHEEKVSAISGLVHTPVTMINDEQVHLSIHEANLTDYASMTLAVKPDKLSMECFLVPWPDGVKVKTKTPMQTPWRTIQISENAASLAESRLILNLNEPQKIKDVAWIKPMKYMGIWWEMHMAKSTWEYGPNHGATTQNTRRYIDFAANNNIDGILVEGWNTGWENWIDQPDFSFTQPYPDYDLAELASYASSKNVQLIGHHETSGDVLAYEEQLEDAFKLLDEHGIRAVKTGYVGPIRGALKGQHHHGQFMINHYRKVIELGAKYKINIVSHEPIKPTGLRRTYPNLLSQEAMRGMEYNAWSEGNPPYHTTVLPFTMGLAGPLDYTPGVIKTQFDQYRAGNSTHSTVANQLALYVVLFSPVQMAADFPEHYINRPEFEFIKRVPTNWLKSDVLDAKIGDYIVVARQERQSEDWFLGAISDENGRHLEVDLTFLDDDADYVAHVYADGDDASYLENSESVVISEIVVRSSDKLNMYLAPGGGQAIHLYKKSPKEMRAEIPSNNQLSNKPQTK